MEGCVYPAYHLGKRARSNTQLFRHSACLRDFFLKFCSKTGEQTQPRLCDTVTHAKDLPLGLWGIRIIYICIYIITHTYICIHISIALQTNMAFATLCHSKRTQKGSSLTYPLSRAKLAVFFLGRGGSMQYTFLKFDLKWILHKKMLHLL